MPARATTSIRDLKRQQTRERLLAAAIVEFRRAGLAAAEISTIVAAAGVAHGTFFFHFPTKEHVLIELEKREEARMAAELRKVFAKPHDLRTVLLETVRVVEKLEVRLGERLFKDFLALHFSTSRGPSEEWAEHPMIVAVVEEIEQARQAGETNGLTDSLHHGVFFLLGLYALLITVPGDPAVRGPVLDQFVATTLHSMTAA
ncbi:TetR/AcrR family transcriptional regulator [Nocardia barduliensis]|uniref:TetR/AcrR family transcriptional regulator n=1 Tax=Nocardia barduliensis TaxID=2736643 RepID=UPI0015727E8C|nr:TetR/AcrR family transcriptional regulator [Nocardia barduliensis]